MELDAKLKVLIAINEANRATYDLFEKFQKEIEKRENEIKDLKEKLNYYSHLNQNQ